MWHGFDLVHVSTKECATYGQRNLHIRVDTAVSTIRASPLLRRLIDLNVLDNQIARIQTLRVRIRLSVLQQAEQELR